MGDGQVYFAAIFTKLTQYGYDSLAVLEWECCVKSAEQGAAEDAPFIAKHLIEPPRQAFDYFAGSQGTMRNLKACWGYETGEN